jgi:hypothetical protein
MTELILGHFLVLIEIFESIQLKDLEIFFPNHLNFHRLILLQMF